MSSEATKTFETTYEYNDVGNVIRKKLVETDTAAMPSITNLYTGQSDAEIETGIELVGDTGVSPLEVFLTAAAGALVGSLLYRVINKN